ncbi:hypothetical protein niasHT_032902 [Heterodera trifolii]|uniref:Ubiquitin-like domain-containing protein n=1 Tax=Heterodera trifolii TaxID=157864 RepID=A0ABD2ILA2_9BILA
MTILFYCFSSSIIVLLYAQQPPSETSPKFLVELNKKFKKTKKEIIHGINEVKTDRRITNLLTAQQPLLESSPEILMEFNDKLTKIKNEIIHSVKDATSSSTSVEMKMIKINVIADRTINSMIRMRLTNKSDQITVKLKENETVQVLKEKIMKKLDHKIKHEIQKELGMKHRKLKPTLKYQQKSAADKDFVELEDDSKTLKDYGIGQNATVHLSFDKFDIFVEFKEENQIEKTRLTVRVKKTDTVEALKRIIQTLTQIEPQRQTLRRDNYGAMLKDTETMANCDITAQRTVYLGIDEFVIHVQMEYGNSKYTVWVNRMDTIRIVKSKICYQMKSHVFYYNFIRAEEQTLKYDGTVGVLDDNGTMAFYGIGAGATVQLSVDKLFEIVVEYEKTEEEQKAKKTMETFSFEVKKTNTVASLKEMFKNATEFMPKRQTLRRFGPHSMVLLDNELMAPIIAIQPTIYLAIDEFQIYVEYDNEKYNTIWVKGTETVAILKKKIAAAGLKPPNDIDPDTQMLQYGTFAVLDDCKALNDYGILKDAIVCLSISTFPIDVAHEDDKGRHHNYIIWVRECDTVKLLKQKIEKKLGFGIPSKLKFKKKDGIETVLKDTSQTLAFYGIGENDNSIYIGQAESAVVVVAPPTEKKAKPTKIRHL